MNVKNLLAQLGLGKLVRQDGHGKQGRRMSPIALEERHWEEEAKEQFKQLKKLGVGISVLIL